MGCGRLDLGFQQLHDLVKSALERALAAIEDLEAYRLSHRWAVWLSGTVREQPPFHEGGNAISATTRRRSPGGAPWRYARGLTGLIGRAGAPDTRPRPASGQRPTSSSRRFQAAPEPPVPRPTATSLTTRCCEPWCSHRARNRCVRATEGSSLTHEHRSPEMDGAGRRRMWLMWRTADPPPRVMTINQRRESLPGKPRAELMGTYVRSRLSQPKGLHVYAALQARAVGHNQPRS